MGSDVRRHISRIDAAFTAPFRNTNMERKKLKMKNVWKKIAALTMVAAMTVPFAGCSNNSASSSAAGDSSAADAGDGSTAAGGTLVIGGIGPITGAASVYGNAVKNGAQLAVNEINAAGGVNGMQLELNFQDDEHDPEKSVNAYNTLKDAGMKLLVGTVTSAPCVAVSAEAAKDNMFLLTPSGSSLDAISAGDNCFRVCFTDPGQGKIAADYIADNSLATKVGIIYDSSDVYSTGILDGFKAEAEEKKLEISAEEAFTADAKTDFSVQIQKVMDSGADLLFLPIYYQEASLILQQAKSAGMNMTVFGGDGLDGLIDQLGDKVDIAQDVLVMTPFAASSPDEKSAKFTAAYEELTGGEVPIQFAADAYDAVYAIKLALEKAGVNDASMSASDICDKVKVAMTEITLDGVTGSTTWTADGEPTKAPQVMKIVVNDGVGSYVSAQ